MTFLNLLRIPCLLLALLTPTCLAQHVPSKSPPFLRIYILQSAAHAALDATRQGIMDELTRQGWEEGNTLHTSFHVLLESMDRSSSMVTKALCSNPKPDFVIGIGTTASQLLFRHVYQAREPDTPQLVFSSVTDPQAAGLVQDLEHPGHHTSGVSNFVPLKPQLVLLKKMMKRSHAPLRLGMIYNPGEMNSVRIIEDVKKIASQLNIILITTAAQNTDKVGQAAMKLRQQNVEACFLHNDNTALSAAKMIFRLMTEEAGIPVFAGDNDMVTLGALFALGPSQRDIGRQTAQMMLKSFREGKDLGTFPVQFPTTTELHINLEAAQHAKLKVSKELLKKAQNVLGKHPS